MLVPRLCWVKRDINEKSSCKVRFIFFRHWYAFKLIYRGHWREPKMCPLLGVVLFRQWFAIYIYWLQMLIFYLLIFLGQVTLKISIVQWNKKIHIWYIIAKWPVRSRIKCSSNVICLRYIAVYIHLKNKIEIHVQLYIIPNY